VTEPGTTALRLRSVRFVRDDRAILDGIDWEVRAGERWVVLGPNGSGKTTLVRIASLYEHPTDGEVEVLGGKLGRVDVRRHRRLVGLASMALADQLRPSLSALDVVMCAKNGALEPWWHTYDDEDRQQARALLGRLGVEHLADHALGTCSSGERQRILLARTLMTDPGLLLLDEPTAGLDLGGREDLVATLDHLAADPASPPVVLVTHHLEEIPQRFDRALLLRDGRVVASGPIEEVLRADRLSACFGIPLAVSRNGGRWQAWRHHEAPTP
jgi:iron complex transport system ATP-binding protein